MTYHLAEDMFYRKSFAFMSIRQIKLYQLALGGKVLVNIGGNNVA